MIAVSSHRPQADSAEVAENQLRARESWEYAFDAITYFGPEEPALAGPQVEFIPWTPFPRIKVLAAYCADQNGWCAIVNADIVMAPQFQRVEGELVNRHASAAMSRRYQFENEDLPAARIVDSGLDFFAAIPIVWAGVAKNIPDQYRIGHIMWDTWMMGFLPSFCGMRVWDITACKCVYHPKHGDRLHPHTIDEKGGKQYTDRVRWPANKLRL